MKKYFLFNLLIVVVLQVKASTADTATIYSAAMHKNIKCVIIKPNSYKKKKNHYPVVYLLHGHSGSYRDWITNVPQIKKYSDDYQIIFVTPDGGYNSWYFDSPIDTGSKYETHICKEVVDYTDTHYRTFADRKHRAITGLSMGGHGSFYLALRHPDIFGAIGSMSGGVDIRPFPQKWQIKEKIGDITTHAEEWEKRSVINMITQCPKDSFAIIFDCGTDDFFYKVNQQLHEKMLQLKIPHDYIQRPGVHNWVYWNNAVQYQILFFRKFFDKQL